MSKIVKAKGSHENDKRRNENYLETGRSLTLLIRDYILNRQHLIRNFFDYKISEYVCAERMVHDGLSKQMLFYKPKGGIPRKRTT